ncbi:HlyD family type I secretion periplasmic adaptor subunit [Methylomonas paludis]|uniref:Membrane fusion protein (MFP) family protein n=1 Tax=Methylomonas paludis TaxID=1173101 RepID=A0A975RAK3_9GAMM|nr:HlyD family type I secretion periplasmic adaptor subunit [Methylomonas paludis]QWF71433.1 HlyD family type I secretion periplasmic adaptor subunit [Methylomonas paludis]
MSKQDQSQQKPPAITLLTDDRPIRVIGYVVLFLTLGVFGAWACLAPIDSAAVAPGYVVVKSHKKTVQHREGGIVSQLLVKDGDVVKEGDALLVLDATENRALLEMARGQYITLAAQLARLEAERDGKKTINFPEQFIDQSDARVLEARQSEEHIFAARKNAHDGEIAVLKQQVSQLQSKIEGLKGMRTSKQTLADSYAEEVKDLRELLSEGFADKLRLRELERNHASNLGDIASINAEIAGSEIQIGETRLKILQLEKRFQEEVTTKYSEVQANLYDINQRLLTSQDKVNRVEIKAPVAGRVMGLAVHTLGGVIAPGYPILEIVPQQEELVIDAQVATLDIDRVSIGMVAEVRFPVFKQALTPIIEGKVINLSADRILDEKTGNTYYQALVELTPESIEKMQHLELLPGMPVEVMIKTGERTLFQYLAKPITNAFARAFVED